MQLLVLISARGLSLFRISVSNPIRPVPYSTGLAVHELLVRFNPVYVRTIDYYSPKCLYGCGS